MNLLSRLFGANQSSADHPPHAVDVQEASRKQAAGALLIDVREQRQRRHGRLG
jgi:hypothetical protein